jgi:MFS family permease
MNILALRNVRTLNSFNNSAFRFYFFGMMGQWGAMNMQMVTNSLLIYRLSGSAAILGMMTLANAVPTLLLSLFGGVLADRFLKKRLIQIAQAASALVALGVAVSLRTGYMSTQHSGSWWVLIATSAFQGVFMALMMPARQAIIPELVSNEQVMNAIALNATGMSIFQLVAPAVSGFLVDAIDFEAVFYIMTALCVMAILLTSFIPSTRVVSIRTKSVLAGVSEGLRYVRSRATILFILVFMIVGILLGMPGMIMLPIFTDDILKVGATGLGILQSVSGAGALFISLALASLPNKRRGMMMIVSCLILGLALAAFAFSRLWPLSIGLTLFVGIGKTVHMVMATTLLQNLTDEKYLGRVMSILMMNMGISSFGTFFCGILAEAIGPQWAVGGFAMGLVLLSILALLFFPSVRKLD